VTSGSSTRFPSGSPAVLVGVGQVRHRPALDGEWDPQEPAVLMAQAIELALRDASAGGGGAVEELRVAATTLACVDPIGWGYEDLVGATAGFANLTPTRSLTWPPGGNSAGDLLHEVVNLIVDGEINTAVLAGSEAIYSVRRARKEAIDLQQRWTPFPGRRDFLKGQRPLTTAVEARHGMVAPIQCYPMYENALRAAAGRSIKEHQQFISALMSRNSQVAATNPNAWFPDGWSVDEIATVDANNRWVCFPYPKRMNAIMEVDQSAAMVLMSQAEADRRGIDRSLQIAFLGGGSCQDPWTPVERPNLAHSAGIAAAGVAAFGHAGLTISDIDLIDLYSCFPSAIQMGMNSLGIAADDPRGVTLTGGLAYAGGPGNSYALHAMCVAVQRLRAGDGSTALVTSLGMTASKHAVSLFGRATSAPSSDFRAHKVQLTDEQLWGPPIVDAISGNGVVVSYTAEFDRAGHITRTIYIVDLDDGSRTVGNGLVSQTEIERIFNTELVGTPVTVAGGALGTSEGDSGTPNLVTLQ
jgi:acetyl-CoA C-acetyltransferase